VLGRPLRLSLAVSALLALTDRHAAAQSVQLLPEADVHLTLGARWKAFLQMKNDRDAGELAQLSIGPSVQVHLTPLVKLKDVTLFDPDDAKRRVFVLEAGYRYLNGADAFVYEHEHLTRTPPNSRRDSVGLVLNLYFSLPRR
jgi:hypothetical protein